MRRRMKRKGSLEETLSYALYRDVPETYAVSYRDRDRIKKATLKSFFQGEEYSDIPITRIVEITRDGELVWEKGQKQVTVKKLGRENR
jgi:uncharacterized protein (UPF0248 family)